jgi:predicted nucleotidyltransferase
MMSDMNPVLEIRTQAGLTQDQLAARSGVAQPNIAAYESGRRVASEAMLERLRRAASRLPHEAVEANRDALLAIATKHGLSNVRLFGSAMRRTDTPESDVDLLVAAPQGTGLLAISAFAMEVEELLRSQVDIVTEGGLRADHPIRREAVPL